MYVLNSSTHLVSPPRLVALLLTAHTTQVTALQWKTVHNNALLITGPPSHVLLQPARREEPCNCVDQAIYTTKMKYK